MKRTRRMGKGYNSVLLCGGPYNGHQIKVDDTSCTLEFSAKGMHGRYVQAGLNAKQMNWQELSK